LTTFMHVLFGFFITPCSSTVQGFVYWDNTKRVFASFLNICIYFGWTPYFHAVSFTWHRAAEGSWTISCFPHMYSISFCEQNGRQHHPGHHLHGHPGLNQSQAQGVLLW
jgi:hypothetical protein